MNCKAAVTSALHVVVRSKGQGVSSSPVTAAAYKPAATHANLYFGFLKVLHIFCPESQDVLSLLRWILWTVWRQEHTACLRMKCLRYWALIQQRTTICRFPAEPEEEEEEDDDDDDDDDVTLSLCCVVIWTSPVFVLLAGTVVSTCSCIFIDPTAALAQCLSHFGYVSSNWRMAACECEHVCVCLPLIMINTDDDQ